MKSQDFVAFQNWKAKAYSERKVLHIDIDNNF